MGPVSESDWETRQDCENLEENLMGLIGDKRGITVLASEQNKKKLLFSYQKKNKPVKRNYCYRSNKKIKKEMKNNFKNGERDKKKTNMGLEENVLC